MKLTSDLVDRTLNQLPVEAIPDNHPAMSQLSRVFGEHTFFLDDDGLLIVEPAGAGEDGGASGQVVKLASWNETHTTLSPHDPERTDILVEFGEDELN
ncbi:MAG TPA: hypothetical protein VMU85_18505 [Stellaceae bacterium]|nr:hypothetical protein [Stellaceae bacterium]